MDKPIKSTKTLVLASPILRIVKTIAHQQSLRSPIHIEMWRPLTESKDLIIMPQPALSALLKLKRENLHLRCQLELAYTNSNFNCYNRAGAEVRGNEFLLKERRRVASGELVMVACDIAGMGKRNTEIGELPVNQAVRSCLNQIRSWRGVFFISQLNSGDEFVFVVDRVDAIGIVPRMDALFKSAGFDGVYGVVNPIGGDYIQSANDGMSQVYQLKQFTKTLL